MKVRAVEWKTDPAHKGTLSQVSVAISILYDLQSKQF